MMSSDGQNGNKSPDTPQAGGWKELAIRHEGIDAAPLIYANHVTIQHSLNEFFVTFFQIRPPAGPELDEPTLEEVDHVTARAMMRVVFTPLIFEQFVAAAQANFKKFADQVSALKESQNADAN